jgi:predicted deacylase
MGSASGEPSWWGQRQPGQLARVNLPDAGGEWELALFVVTGTRPGPTLAVLAGVHGDEYEGPVAIADLLAGLDPAALAGTLVALPVANPPAFSAGTRTSPLDGLNLARTFDGDATGSASERLAWTIAGEVIGVADALIDLHSGGVAYAMATLVGYCDLGNEVGQRSRELALAFGAPVIWEHPEIAPGRTLSAALDRGIPCVYTEAAGGGAAPADVVQCYIEGVRRVLIALGMLPGEPSRPRHRETWRGSGNTDRSLEATQSGLFRSAVRVGEDVAAGQLLGEIVDYDGTVVERVIAPAAGVVAMARRVPRVSAGDGLYLLTTRVTVE